MRLPAIINNSDRFRALTAPDIACETGISPALDSINKLIVLPSNF
jgi:hypothetical protein